MSTGLTDPGRVPAGGRAGEPLLECAAATRTYRRGGVTVTAVHAASCVVTAGMRVALTGPSGSGKSTLLHVLAGLEPLSSGTITWPGLGGSPAERPGAVGVVFQGPSLVPALDVLENVALPLRLAGVEDALALERSGAALDRLGLGGLTTALPEEISGGQAQRVSIARVLAAAPRLVLADEPTGRLDHATGARVVDVLLETVDEVGAALLVATHDPEVARRLPDRWRMDDGRLTAGTPA